MLLHGFAGTPEDLEPFARSIGVGARFVFPQGPVELASLGLPGRAWWASDGTERAAAIRTGTPRDLSEFEPEGLAEARIDLARLLDALSASSETPLVLGGFSQGAMLAFELALQTSRPIRALVQLSGARIASSLWNPRLATRAGTRAFISHGRQDQDLSFSATERFERDLTMAGWLVDFCPFDGGHENSAGGASRLGSGSYESCELRAPAREVMIG